MIYKFLVDSWTRTLKKSNKNSYKNLIPKEYYNLSTPTQIDNILAGQGIKMAIINDKEEIEYIDKVIEDKIVLSYVLYKPALLFQCYTKKKFRKRGYMKKLLTETKLINVEGHINAVKVTDSFFYFCKHNKIKINHLPIIYV